MKNKIYKVVIIPCLISLTLSIFLTSEYFKSSIKIKAQQKEIERLEWFENRVKNYMLINLKQSEIINRYQSSRNDAQQDSTLHELTLNLE